MSPNDWALTFDGETVSLQPSIGNWEFECRSHYWIKRSNVKWAEYWFEKRVLANRIKIVEKDIVLDEPHDSKPKKRKIWNFFKFLFGSN